MKIQIDVHSRRELPIPHNPDYDKRRLFLVWQVYMARFPRKEKVTNVRLCSFDFDLAYLVFRNMIGEPEKREYIAAWIEIPLYIADQDEL